MQHNPIETVEIVEPPIGELTKRHGGLKRGCFAGCGCFVVVIIAAIIGIKLFLGPGPKPVNDVPQNFPKDIPLYDRDNVESITYISGTYKSRSLEIAGLFPKFILSPLLLETEDTLTVTPQKGDTLKRMWNIMTTPVGDSRDTIQVQWININAEPSFVISYYRTELRKQGFTTSEPDTENLSLTFERGRITGTLRAQKDPTATNGTSVAALTVNYPISAQSNTPHAQ